MKRSLLVIAATLAATIAGLNAEEGSFERLLTKSPAGAAGTAAPSVPAAVLPAGVAAASATSISSTAQRDWLVLVFINGVNDLGILGYADKSINDMEKVGSTDRMAVLVEYGKLGRSASASHRLQQQRGSRTLYITRDADASRITSPVIYDSNDADMGSTANLVRFIKRGLRKFPAKKVAVVVWNHGGGRLGIAWDDVSQNHMEVDQLGAALGQVKEALGRKIDVFATDACLMQMAEVAYELKDSANVIVGSEESVPDDSFPYNTFLAQLAADPGMGPELLGSAMVDAYGAYYKSKATLSALRSSGLDGFMALLNSWVAAIKADPKAFKVAADQDVVDAAFSFSADDSKDLYDYLLKVNARLGTASPAAKSAGVALQNYIAHDLIIRTTVLPFMFKAHGLAIYIPDLRYDSANYEKLAFAADSQWDDFLRKMMEERLK